MMEMFKGTVTPRDWAITGGILGGTVLLGVAFYFLVYSFQTKILAGVQAQFDQKQTELTAAINAEQHIDALRAAALKMDQLVTQFEMRLPESREIPTLLKQFEGFASDAGLRVELSQLARESDPKKETETIPYSVKAKGSFHQIASFINRLERFQRYLKVSDLKIDKEKDGIAEASFTLSTYRFIQSAAESAKS